MLDLSIVIGCLMMNAFFSAYEMAFVTTDENDLDQLEDGYLLAFKKKTERTLSVIQIGITLVGAVAAAVGGTGAVETLEPYLSQKFSISSTASEAIAVTLIIIPLTYFSVVFGELVPKSIALRFPIEVLKFGTKIIYIFDKFLTPLVTILEISTRFILRILKLDKTENEDFVSEVVEIGTLPEYHRKFVHNLISVKNTPVAKIMKSWDIVEKLDFGDTDEDVEAKIQASTHSRFPVVDGDVLVGIFHWKEWEKTSEESLVPWQSILGPSLKVKKNEKVLDVFLKMQEGNHHLAIITDGELEGLVSMEDILETIVGNIKDDLERNKISRILSRRPKIKL